MTQRVRDVGEIALVSAITSALPDSEAIVGPGDDAAVLADGTVVCTDVAVDRVHFRTDWCSGRDIGHRIAAANIADIAAMGGRATALVAGLAVPPATPVDLVEEIAAGLAAEARTVGASLVGGDIVASDQLMISVAALGTMDGRSPVTRSGARAGHLIVLAGRLGHAAAGLATLLDGGDDQEAIAAYRRPIVPYAVGVALAEAGASAMIDVSDGLHVDAGRIAQSSGVRLAFDFTAVAACAGRYAEFASTGGDDHALLATIDPAAVGQLGDLVHVIGEVRRGQGVGGLPPGPGGYDHFPVSDGPRAGHTG